MVSKPCHPYNCNEKNVTLFHPPSKTKAARNLSVAYDTGTAPVPVPILYCGTVLYRLVPHLPIATATVRMIQCCTVLVSSSSASGVRGKYCTVESLVPRAPSSAQCGKKRASLGDPLVPIQSVRTVRSVRGTVPVLYW